MKDLKKAISLLLAMGMTAGISGCGEKKESKGGTGEVPTLVWCLPGDKNPDMEQVLNEVNKITEQKIGAKINIQMIDTGAFSEKMAMKMASGDAFDICFTGFINPYGSGVELGGYAPLKELIKEYAPELEKKFPEYALKCAEINGDYYAIPSLQVMAQYPGLFVREDYYEKYGFDKLERIGDTRELEPIFEQIVQNEQGIYPINGALVNNNDYWVISSSPAIYMKMDDTEHKVIFGADLPNAAEQRTMAHEWYLKGYIRPDIDTCPSDAEEIKAGRYVCFSGRYKPGIETEHLNTYGRKFKFIPMGDPILPQGTGVDSMTAISAQSKNKEKAIQFIELMNTDAELFNLVAYGLEGKHYTKLEDGKHIRLIENSGYKNIEGWKLGNQFLAYLLEGQADDTWEKTKELNDSAKVSPLLGLSFNNEAIKSQLSQVKAANGEFVSMHKGSADPNSGMFDNYMKKMTDAGIYDIVAEYQRQIDEWFANKK